jgi:hypothetical protein
VSLDEAVGIGERRAMAGDVEARLLEDYKIQVQALTNQYSRLWTRFNFFITIHSALLVALLGLFKDEDVEWTALAIPLLGVLMSALWFVTGAQDRYLVVFYRAMITHAANRVAPSDDQWAHPGLEIEAAEKILGTPVERSWLQWRSRHVSVTRLPAIVPVVIGTLWLAATVGLALGID